MEARSRDPALATGNTVMIMILITVIAIVINDIITIITVKIT